MFQYVIRAMSAIKIFVLDGRSRSAHENLILSKKVLQVKTLFNKTLAMAKKLLIFFKILNFFFNH
jgi:hypothetical protein